MIVIAGTVCVRPERRDDAVRAARAMIAATRRETGCRAYGFHADLDDPNLFLVFEEWESEEALVRHFGTEHMATFGAQLPGLLAGPPKLTRYIVSAADPM